MDPRFAPQPQRASGGPSWWHDDLVLLLAVLFVLSLVGGAVYAVVTTGVLS
jgi:hypothetical protein